jgi:hypothetical protein
VVGPGGITWPAKKNKKAAATIADFMMRAQGTRRILEVRLKLTLKPLAAWS